MAKEPKKIEVIKEEAEKQPEITYETQVMDSIIQRGLNISTYDNVKPIFLWTGHYRVNCHKNHKIVNSYFIRFSKDEGLLWSVPKLPLDED